MSRRGNKTTPSSELSEASLIEHFRQGLKRHCAIFVWEEARPLLDNLLKSSGQKAQNKTRAQLLNQEKWDVSRFANGNMSAGSLFTLFHVLRRDTIGLSKDGEPTREKRVHDAFRYALYRLNGGADSAPAESALVAGDDFAALLQASDEIPREGKPPSELDDTDWEKLKDTCYGSRNAQTKSGQRFKQLYMDWHEHLQKLLNAVPDNWYTNE